MTAFQKFLRAENNSGLEEPLKKWLNKNGYGSIIKATSITTAMATIIDQHIKHLTRRWRRRAAPTATPAQSLYAEAGYYQAQYAAQNAAASLLAAQAAAKAAVPPPPPIAKQYGYGPYAPGYGGYGYYNPGPGQGANSYYNSPYGGYYGTPTPLPTYSSGPAYGSYLPDPYSSYPGNYYGGSIPGYYGGGSYYGSYGGYGGYGYGYGNTGYYGY